VTAAEGRSIKTDGVFNLRDLGGLPTLDGRVVRAGQVLRAEALAAPGTGEVYAVYADDLGERMAHLGIRTVVDLRTDVECENAPGLWALALGAELVRVPIMEGAPGSDTDIFAMLLDGRLQRLTPERLGQFYVESIARRPADFGRAVSLIAADERRPLLIHCTGGKDRTGILAALLLSLLGVDEDLIVEDYAQTGINRPDRVSHYVDLLANNGKSTDEARVLFETPPEAMRIMLDDLRRRYGTAREYLESAGAVPAATLDHLRDVLLTR
jgi:protein-tyrosine phosphatase